MPEEPSVALSYDLDELRMAYQELAAAEEELRRQTEELQDAHGQVQIERRRYRQLFNEAPDGYILTDRFGRIRELNFSAMNIIGRDAGESVGKPIFVFIGLGQRTAARQALLALLGDHQSRTVNLEIPTRSSGPRPFEARLAIVHNTGQDEPIIRWILRDLAHLQRANEAERERELLRRSNLAKDELLGLVSHELRTPLTIILGAARALARLVPSGDSIESELLTDITQSAERLRGIVDNMLALARLEHEGDITLEPVLLQRFLPGTLDRERQLYPGREFTLEVESALPPVLASPVFLDQVVQNLLSNAVKYGDPEKPVMIASATDGETVAVSVRNEGPVVDLDFQRLFQPFYRAEATASGISGAGLGLSACRRLLDAQGGSISAEARPEGGLDVTFRLPVCAVDD